MNSIRHTRKHARRRRNLARGIAALLLVGGGCVTLCAFAQSEERVVVPTNVTFYLPYRDGTPEIRTNLMRATYVVEVYDLQGQLLRQGNVETASTRPNPTSDARSYMFRIAERFDVPAGFRVVKKFSGVDETNRPVREERSWLVEVQYPTMSAAVSVDSTYFFSETAYIPFAAVQYPDHPSYSYRIESEGGGMQDSGRGAMIDLRSVLRNPRNVGKLLIARGLYEGKTFKFVNPKNSKVEETVWRFRVEPPTLSPVGIPWADLNDRMTPILSLSLPSKYDPNVFSYVYVDTKDTANYVVSTPALEGVRVLASPPSFVKSMFIRTAGVFSQIVIIPNRQLIGKEGLPVTLILRFQDARLQIPYEKRYKAMVYQ